MMLDVDFVVSPNLSEVIKQNTLAMEMLKIGDVGLVVPAFEFTDGQDEVDMAEFPRHKQVRLLLWYPRVPKLTYTGHNRMSLLW